MNSLTIFNYALVSARWRECRRQFDIHKTCTARDRKTPKALSTRVFQKIMERKHSESFRVQSGIYNKISKKIQRKWTPKKLKIEAWRDLGALGGDLGKKNLSKAVLADLGGAQIVQNLAPVAQDGAKLEPRWRQDGGPRCILRPFGAIFTI